MTIIGGLALLSPVPIWGQGNITGQITTEIIVPLSVCETEQLNFGNIINETGGGKVLISPEGERIVDGEVTATDGLFSAGKFLIVGEPGKLVTVVLPQQSLTITRDKGGEELTVDDFTSDVPEDGTEIEKSSGKAEISIGATLHVGTWAESPEGFYTGSYQVMFSYN